MNWIRIGSQMKPMKGTRILAFTPSNPALRYRIVDEDLLPTMREATHWMYLTPPADFWQDDTEPKYEIV